MMISTSLAQTPPQNAPGVAEPAGTIQPAMGFGHTAGSPRVFQLGQTTHPFATGQKGAEEEVSTERDKAESPEILEDSLNAGALLSPLSAHVPAPETGAPDKAMKELVSATAQRQPVLAGKHGLSGSGQTPSEWHPIPASQISAADTASSSTMADVTKTAKVSLAGIDLSVQQQVPNTLSQTGSPALSTATQSQTSAATPATMASPEWAPVRVDTSQGKWGEQMMQVLQDRVTLQAQQNLQEARIRLDPPDLGKLDLLVRVEGDRLSVQINANTVATREALIQVSERLRADLQNQHFVHVDVNVGDGESGASRHSHPEDDLHIFAARESQDDTPSSVAYGDHWLNTQA